MVKENKASKYLLYAIGEIILVVIGILIALSINNWNQERLERKNEHKILKDLKVEFEANFYDLNRVIEQHKTVFNEYTELQRITVAKTYDSKILNSLMLSPTKWFSFTQRPGASENLISSGNLNIISNKILRDLITQWSGIVDDVIDDETFCTDFTKDTYLPFLAKHYPASNLEYPHQLFFNAFAQNFRVDATPIIKIKDVDWQQLLNNSEFQSLISLKKIYEMHAIDAAEIALVACNEIIAQINSELE